MNKKSLFNIKRLIYRIEFANLIIFLNIYNNHIKGRPTKKSFLSASIIKDYQPMLVGCNKTKPAGKCIPAILYQVYGCANNNPYPIYQTCNRTVLTSHYGNALHWSQIYKIFHTAELFPSLYPLMKSLLYSMINLSTFLTFRTIFTKFIPP